MTSVICEETWVSLIGKIYNAPAWLTTWMGSGFWTPFILAFAVAISGCVIWPCWRAYRTIKADMPDSYAFTHDIFAVTRLAFKGYRLAVVCFVAGGMLLLYIYLRRFQSPCHILGVIGADRSIWQLSPQGVDLLVESLLSILVIMFLGLIIASVAVWLVRYGPLPSPMFALRLKSSPIRFWPRGAIPGEGHKGEVWERNATRVFRHRCIYFSAEGEDCRLASPQDGNFFRLSLTQQKDDEHHEYMLIGPVKERQVGLQHFVFAGEIDDIVRPKHSFVIGDNDVEFDFVFATWEG